MEFVHQHFVANSGAGVCYFSSILTNLWMRAKSVIALASDTYNLPSHARAANLSSWRNTGRFGATFCDNNPLSDSFCIRAMAVQRGLVNKAETPAQR